MHDLDNHIKFGAAVCEDFDDALRGEFDDALHADQRNRRTRPNQADVLIGVAIGAIVAMFVSLGWLLASSTSNTLKIFGGMLCLSTVAIGCVVMGYVRWESGRMRRQLADHELRLMAALERSLSTAADPTGYPDSLRPQAVHRGVDESLWFAEDGSPLPSGLQIFLLGRDSTYPGDSFGERFP